MDTINYGIAMVTDTPTCIPVLVLYRCILILHSCTCTVHGTFAVKMDPLETLYPNA